jgi:hypothetical protein
MIGRVSIGPHTSHAIYLCVPPSKPMKTPHPSKEIFSVYFAPPPKAIRRKKPRISVRYKKNLRPSKSHQERDNPPSTTPQIYNILKEEKIKQKEKSHPLGSSHHSKPTQTSKKIGKKKAK